MNVLVVQSKKSALFPTKNIIDLEAWTPATTEGRAVYSDIMDAVKGEESKYVEQGYRTHAVIVENELDIEPPCEVHETVYVACT